MSVYQCVNCVRMWKMVKVGLHRGRPGLISNVRQFTLAASTLNEITQHHFDDSLEKVYKKFEE